jgi:hypothetical protein
LTKWVGQHFGRFLFPNHLVTLRPTHIFVDVRIASTEEAHFLGFTGFHSTGFTGFIPLDDLTSASDSSPTYSAVTRVARWHIFKRKIQNPKSKIQNLEGLAREYIGIFYGHLVYFTSI